MITSTANQQIKQVLALQQKAKLRNELGLYVIEGIKLVAEAAVEDILSVFATEAAYEKNIELLRNMQCEIVSDKVMEHMSDIKTPQGVLAVLKQKKYAIEEFMNIDKPLFVILETLQDPGNLGTILRTSEGAGVTAVIMNKECVDIYNPKVIRSTMGSLFRVPFVYVEDLEKVLSDLKNNRVNIYAGHLDSTKDYDEYDYKDGTAFLIGNEGNGLSDRITSFATHTVKISMSGKLESLNAAVSTAILIYEAKRQRK